MLGRAIRSALVTKRGYTRLSHLRSSFQIAQRQQTKSFCTASSFQRSEMNGFSGKWFFAGVVCGLPLFHLSAAGLEYFSRTEKESQSEQLKSSSESRGVLSHFEPIEVLSSNKAMIAFWCKARATNENVLTDEQSEDSQFAVVTIKRADLPAAEKVSKILFSDGLQSKVKADKIFENDIYSTYAVRSDDLSSMTVEIVFPATEQHKKKALPRRYLSVSESPDLYNNVTAKLIEREHPRRLKWIDNIFDGKAEQDRILVMHKPQDVREGFFIAKNMGFQTETPEDLDCIVTVRDPNLRTIRDLRGEHVSLLKRAREEALNVVKAKYGVDSGDLRLFFHYPPSYHRLHIHITHRGLANASFYAPRAVVLDEVIDNLEKYPDYYKNCTKSIEVIAESPLAQSGDV